jgi:molecular chaperone IbpA
MSNLALFTPLMRQTVGFDRFNDLFEKILNDSDERFEAYPPYNIEKLSDDNYRITLAVAGFREEDLNIIAEGDKLVVSGRHSDDTKETQTSYLHRGIAARAFERTFRLADHIRVGDAAMENGLLTIDLMREIPEEKKPRMIPIGGSYETRKLTGKKK